MKKKNILLTVTVIASAAISMAGCDAIKDSNSNLNLGMDAIEAQDYSGALGYFDEAINKGEDLRLSYRGQGMAYMGVGEYDNACKSFAKALHQSNGLVKKVDYDISYYLAVAELKAGEIDKAYETYSAILALNKRSADAYFLRGRVELIRGNKDSAKADFDKAVELKPSDYNLYIGICEDLEAAGYEAEGKSYIERAMESGSKKNDYQLGMLNYYMGQYDEAKNYLEKSRESSDSEKVLLYLGKCYEALGDMNYAATLYSGYVDTENASAAVYNELGLMYIKQQDYRSALDAFESGIALNDMTYMQSLKFNEIVAHEYLADFDKASVLMKEYLETYPNDEEAQRENMFLSTR